MTIGIEVHVQLSTNSKIFCSCPVATDAEPNKNICQICTGHPGVLPQLNRMVVQAAIAAGLATHSKIHSVSEFARKHYFYPDLPKNYQISQHDKPICTDGYVPIYLEDGSLKKIRLIRIHMEEDAGKNMHAPGSNESFVNLNRTGTPLLEIVSHPDISSAAEARIYLKTLRDIVTYLGICTGNMEEGAFRADTNISLKPAGSKTLGTRCELKNINSFKFISDAIEYEIERQASLLDAGKPVIQETRSWDTKGHKTILLRSKEEAADYRYFPDPDLPLVCIDTAWIEEVRKKLPELPFAKFERLQKNYNLSTYEATILIDDKILCDYFEQCARYTKSPRLINWVLRDLMAFLKDKSLTLPDIKLSPQHFAELINVTDNGIITMATARTLFEELLLNDQSPTLVIKQRGLEQVGSQEELESIIKEIIEKNPRQVQEYKSGKDKLFGFFVGEAMKKTRGKGNPLIINELLKKYLS